MKLANIASLDPKISERGKKGLEGASSLDRKIWNRFNNDWDSLIAEADALERRASVGQKLIDNNSLFNCEGPAGPSTTTALIQQRVGQDFFRRAVLANYNNTCCVTGIDDTHLINASHIVPWSKDKKNRHNPKNGLCLSATFDRAFDRGLMTVNQTGCIVFSNKLLSSNSTATRKFFETYEGKPLISPLRFDPDPLFLRWHRENCFQSGYAYD